MPIDPRPGDNFYEYRGSGMIVCGECLTRDLRLTAHGMLVGDERVYSGMFIRLKDDHTEAYMCDSCGFMNGPYEQMGESP